MKRSSFRHYPLSQASRHQLEIKNFLGVDYSTQKFAIQNGHAIDSKNYIWKDGVVQKRRGIEHLATVRDFSYIPADFSEPTSPALDEIHTNGGHKAINGIWSFEAEDGAEHTVAHIGRLMYEIKGLQEGESMELKPLTLGTASAQGEVHDLAYEFDDYRSFAVVGGKKLWFLGGNMYMCLRFLPSNQGYACEFRAVEDSALAPIPTTTISITCKNSTVSQRMGLDKTNLLTEWRRNGIITGTPKSEDDKTKTTFFEYTLDAPLIIKSVKDLASIEVTMEEQGEIEQ